MPKIITEKDKANKKNFIIDKAYELFETREFHEITMNDIAKNCGMAKGTLFNYFETKETLFSEMLYKEYTKWGIHEIKQLKEHKKFSKVEYHDFILKETLNVIKYRKSFVRLAAVKRTIMNQNIKPEIIFKQVDGLHKSLTMITNETINKIDFLTPKQIYDVYTARHIILIGGYNIATNPELIEKHLHIDELQGVIDMEQNVMMILDSYLNNLLGL